MDGSCVVGAISSGPPRWKASSIACKIDSPKTKPRGVFLATASFFCGGLGTTGGAGSLTGLDSSVARFSGDGCVSGLSLGAVTSGSSRWDPGSSKLGPPDGSSFKGAHTGGFSREGSWEPDTACTLVCALGGLVWPFCI